MGSVHPTVSVILVNYNTAPLTVRCISSLLKQEGVDFDVFVVDNASADGSAQAIAEAFPDEVILIENRENVGFGVANNLAVRSARGEFLFLLNPDTELKEPDILARLIAFLNRHPEFAMAGSAVYEPRKSKWAMPSRRYPAEKYLRHGEHLRRLSGDIAWILGASMMVRKAVYEEIGGFDPDFFLYGEDVDICLRLRQAGYQIGYCPDAVIHHVAGASESGRPPLETRLRKKRGFFLFCRKHYHPEDFAAIARRTLSRGRWYTLGLKFQRLLGKDVSARLQRTEAGMIAAREALESFRVQTH